VDLAGELLRVGALGEGQVGEVTVVSSP
jgi:hypothetical protein